ncbi:unnamed protein product [Durusdinium trenchii]|uniref:C3H1-type domain-containing protein n=1 Tax=Durusdinium trenchii TaxID=1381693 RepID=A0ABP0LDJ9_9DINO
MVRREAVAPREKHSGTVRLEAFKQTRLCKFHIAGNCIRGTSCNFAHSVEQIRHQPDFSKTRLCADFMESRWCRDGDYCKFAHGEHELRPHPASKTKEQETKQSEVIQPCKSPQVATATPELQTSKSPKHVLKSSTWFDEGCTWLGSEAIPMFPWYAYVEYQFPDDLGWDTNSQFSGEWNEWNDWNEWNEWNEWNGWHERNPASSNNSTTCTESPLQGPIANPTVPDGNLIFDLGGNCAPFQSEVRVKNTFLHIDVTDSEDEDGPYTSPSLRRSPSAPSRLVMLGED